MDGDRMPAKATILIVDFERNLRQTWTIIFQCAGYRVLSAACESELWLFLQQGGCDLVFIDDNSKPAKTAHHLAVTIHQIEPDLPIIIQTGQPIPETQPGAQPEDGIVYAVKPVDPAHILAVIKEALAKVGK